MVYEAPKTNKQTKTRSDSLNGRGRRTGIVVS